VHDDLLTVAAGAVLYIPTGSTSAYASDGSVRVAGRVLGAGRAGPLVYAGQVALEYRSQNENFGGSELGSELRFGASAGAKVVNDRLIVGPEIFGSTVVTSSVGAFHTTNTPLEWIFGAHFLAADQWRIGAGVGSGLTRGIGTPDARVVASFEWAPRPPAQDRDHDGVADDVDACPDVPGVATTDPKTNGCPPAPADRDADGVPDGEDACPDVAGVRTDDPKTNGCPAAPPDRDADGVPDGEDACPDVAGVKTDDPKTNGCPPDRDHDTIADAIDACPDVAGVVTDDPKTNGCPADSDGDGILDTEDACPKEAGPRDADPKRNGCPRAILRQGKIHILDQVKFRSASAELDPASDPLLEAVRAVMDTHPELKKIRVEGHTDNRGGAAYNRKLSESRAASVMGWLVKHGIAQDRLTSQGFGQSQPIDSNRTEDGRRNNRRVEFTVIDPPSGPAGEDEKP
jgi:outer membrane protein OmpA-like peptidoglycan-associated protein